MFDQKKIVISIFVIIVALTPFVIGFNGENETSIIEYRSGIIEVNESPIYLKCFAKVTKYKKIMACSFSSKN